MFKKDKKKQQNNIQKNQQGEKLSRDPVNQGEVQVGLQIKFPGCEKYVPFGRGQYHKIYKNDISKRLLIILDEVAELLQPTGGRSAEDKEEDKMKAEIETCIKSITQLGRSAGIHMILAPLRLSTLVPTTDGMKMICEIEVGDFVFDKYGWSVEVVGVSDIKMSEKMYEITLENSYGERAIEGADNLHYFPIVFSENLKLSETRGIETLFSEEKKMNMEEIFSCWEDGKTMFIPGYESNRWKVINIKRVENELVRCIKIDSEDEIFMIYS